MVSKKKITISWSGGKDSAFALFKILASGEYEVVNLHTVIDKDTKRVGLHGVREALIEQQANCLGIPLVKLYLTASNDHEAYASLMKCFYKVCAMDGISHIIFGDIFLEDLRLFRESLLVESFLIPGFPLWKIPTTMLLSDFMDADFKTVICSADAALFSSEQLGVVVDKHFQDALPDGVDPCGERGEFHTFVFDGPIFKKPVAFERGEIVKRGYAFNKTMEDGSVVKQETSFWFQDLLPRSVV